MFKSLFVFLQFLAITALAQPSFKGGSGALNSFLTSNIVYPEFSRLNCISATIQVGFKLDKAGKVQDVKVVRGLGIDLDDEAVRVVKLTTGNWTVPENYTDAEIVLPIRFDPDPTRCFNNNQNVSSAIAAYKVRQEQENAVTNYYKNKYLGKADPTKEPNILALKEQLGFDDEFITDLLSQANKKLKQGDKAGACEDWLFIRNIGSDKAESYIEKYCK
jgi:TonB family protein